MRQKRKANNKTKCRYCGKSISPGRDNKRRYCNDAHKQAAYRLRRESQLLR